MGVSLSRRLAAFIGHHAGVLAHALRWRTRPVPAPAAAARGARRILIVRCDHIGDAFMSVPAIAWIRRTFPDAHLSLIVASWSESLFKGCSLIDELIVHDPPWWTKRRRARFGGTAGVQAGWFALLRMIASLRSRRFDLCVELRGDPRQMLAYGYLAGARFILSRDRHGSTGFADFAPPIDDGLHEIAQNLQLVRHLAPRADASHAAADFFVPFDEGDRASLRALLSVGLGDPDEPVIVAHPGAKHVNQWPVAHWREWLAGIESSTGSRVRVMLTGGPGELALCEAIAKGYSSVEILAGRLTLRQTAALMDGAALVVMGDTGPMHLLNAVKTPAIVLFGPTAPSRYAPRGAHVQVVQSGPCCVAGNHEICLRARASAPSACMASISPQAVIVKTRQGLESSLL